MTDLQAVIGLLYRADWTRLSMSADVRFESDRDLVTGPVRATRAPGSWRARLLIAPGGRYRQEYDEPSGLVMGNDGERGWMWHQPDQVPPPWAPNDFADEPPVHELLCPSELLGGFTLEVRGPVTACGRDAIAVTAAPRTGIGHMSRPRAGSVSGHLEVIVDAELGILLRYEKTSEGQRLSLTELTAIVLDPPEAADRSRFAPPAGSRIGPDPGQSLWETFSGPDGKAARTAAGLAAGGLGALIRLAPQRPGRPPFHEGDREAAMPPAEPAALEAENGPLPPDDLLSLLYRSGENPAFTATLHQWHDLAAMTARVPDPARAAGQGGVGYFIDSLTAATHGKPVAHTVGRLRLSGRDKYRVDYPSRPGRNHPKTIACDGEHRWQAFAGHTVIGPAHPPPYDIAHVVDPSWLLGCRLSGGTKISYRGRRAYQLSAARGGDDGLAAPLLFFPADVIVDAELGCVLRLISFAGDRPASWWELSGIETEPVPPAEFGLDVPPGIPVVEETGNAFADAALVMPGAAGYAVRTAADVVQRSSGVVSAARSFLDDLRGRGRSSPTRPRP